MKDINVKKSTEKQKETVEFIESLCNIGFTGDIDDYYIVSDFIANYFDVAMEIMDDAINNYYSHNDY